MTKDGGGHDDLSVNELGVTRSLIAGGEVFVSS